MCGACLLNQIKTYTHNLYLEIRLNGFKSHHAGRIEVLHKGVWGTINSRGNTFGYREAKVACRQLGFPDALRPLNHNEVPAVARGPIWSKKIQCNGTESNLRDCNWIKDGSKYMTHYWDSGVICKMRKLRLVYNPIFSYFIKCF